MKQDLIDLMGKFRNVHRRFLELERLDAQKRYEQKFSPLDFLLNLTQDERFAWLRPLSTMIVALDDALDEAEDTPETRKLLLDEIARTLALPRIKERYEAHIRSDPDFTFLHAEFEHAVDGLAT